MPVGTQTIRITSDNSGWNINWFDICAVALRSASIQDSPQEELTSTLKFPTYLSVGSSFKAIDSDEISRSFTLKIYSISGKLQFTTNRKNEAWVPSHIQKGLFAYQVSYQTDEGLNCVKSGKVIVK